MLDRVNDTQFNVSAVQVLSRKHAQFMMRLASADRLAPDLGTLHGAELLLLCLYLQADAMVTRDPSGTQRFMDSGNVHFKQHLLAELHLMLLGSPVFAPLA
jgi:hypothetical protein